MLGQRAELTFKHNITEARHGWLRLTPAYSVKIVEEILSGKSTQMSVLDPFSGTATTPLCAAMRGHDAVSMEINPFLAWFGRAKLGIYSNRELVLAEKAGKKILNVVLSKEIKAGLPPPIHNIERWWNARDLDFLCRLNSAVEIYFQGEKNHTRDLVTVAFCKTLIQISNAAFNHQSMSFKNNENHFKQLSLGFDGNRNTDLFEKNLLSVLQSASLNPQKQAAVIHGDSREIHRGLDRKFDLVITSPPYPNRMSYIRELRPYMYWLGFLKESRDAGDLDWNSIGGTWGSATSRLATWEKHPDTFSPKYLTEIMDRIAGANVKSGVILAEYIGKYFEDIWMHLRQLKNVLNKNAEVHYIVGNSKFYDVILPVERIYRDMFLEAGFRGAEIHIIRKRNSKKELYEYDVAANL